MSNTTNVKIQHFLDDKTGHLVLTIATERLANGMTRVAAAASNSKEKNKVKPGEPLISRQEGRRIALERLNGIDVSAPSKVIEIPTESLPELIRTRKIVALLSRLKPRKIRKAKPTP